MMKDEIEQTLKVFPGDDIIRKLGLDISMGRIIVEGVGQIEGFDCLEFEYLNLYEGALKGFKSESLPKSQKILVEMSRKKTIIIGEEEKLPF